MRRHLAMFLLVTFVVSSGFGGSPRLESAWQANDHEAVERSAAENRSVEEVEVLSNVVLRLVEERKIHCKSAGMIARSELKEGLFVSAGQIVVRLEAAKSQLQLRRLEADHEILTKQANSTVELDFGQKSIEVAAADFDRAVESNRKFPGLYPEPEINRLKLLLERARAEYAKNAFQLEVLALQADAKKIEISIAQVDLDDRTIQAPIDGMIVEVLRRPGEWVELSEPVAKMVRLDRLRLEVDVPIQFTPQQLETVQATFITDALPGGYLSALAEVVFVHPEVNPITRTSRVWFDVLSPEGQLRPGLSGRLELRFTGESP